MRKIKNNLAEKSAREPVDAEVTLAVEATAQIIGTDMLRRLKWDELVNRGDFIANAAEGFELWEGPSGFRADTFVKPIYRKRGSRATVEKLA